MELHSALKVCLAGRADLVADGKPFRLVAFHVKACEHRRLAISLLLTVILSTWPRVWGTMLPRNLHVGLNQTKSDGVSMLLSRLSDREGQSLDEIPSM